MSEVDSLLYQYLNNIPEGPTKVAIEHLFDILRQTRTRTGGDNDLVSSIESETAVNFYAGALFEPVPEDLTQYSFGDNAKSLEELQRYMLMLS